MPSAFTHAAAATAIGTWFSTSRDARLVIAIGALCAVFPDVDAIGFWAGVPGDAFLGHRGLTHSIPFAAALAALVTVLLRRRVTWPARKLWLFLFAATASHGILDAFTNGGQGIALLSPFTQKRFFAPMRPIAVSPISITGFFTQRGANVFRSELKWVWLPSLVCAAFAMLWHRRRRLP